VKQPPRLPAWPAAAESAVEPAALRRLAALGELLATHGVERGLLGPREVPRLWERHLLNCAVLQPLIPADATGLCDVGSGAGLPGLVIAALRPDLPVTLLEPLQRRTTFLAEAVSELGLARVEVLRGRAEDWADRRDWPVVTARAVAPLERLARWCLPLLGSDGVLLALKGASAAAEVAAANAVLARLGAGPPDVLELPTPGTSDTTFVVRVRTVKLPGRVQPRKGRRR
jgi:16S rRNA (guanine527-N7)-methyltransferase